MNSETVKETVKREWVEIVKYVFFLSAFFVFCYFWIRTENGLMLERKRIDEHQAAIIDSQKKVEEAYKQLIASRQVARDTTKSVERVEWNGQLAHAEVMRELESIKKLLHKPQE